MAWVMKMEDGIRRCQSASHLKGDSWYMRHWPADAGLIRALWSCMASGETWEIRESLFDIATHGGLGGEQALRLLEDNFNLDLLSLEDPSLVPILLDVRSRRQLVWLKAE